MKYGVNVGSGLQFWQNLVEKLNAEKIDPVPVEDLGFVKGQG